MIELRLYDDEVFISKRHLHKISGLSREERHARGFGVWLVKNGVRERERHFLSVQDLSHIPFKEVELMFPRGGILKELAFAIRDYLEKMYLKSSLEFWEEVESIHKALRKELSRY